MLGVRSGRQRGNVKEFVPHVGALEEKLVQVERLHRVGEHIGILNRCGDDWWIADAGFYCATVRRIRNQQQG